MSGARISDGAAGGVDMSETNVVWTDESRAGVDASIKRARRMTGETRRDCRGREIRSLAMTEVEESCPECGYVITAVSFPEICAYCGSSF